MVYAMEEFTMKTLLKKFFDNVFGMLLFIIGTIGSFAWAFGKQWGEYVYLGVIVIAVLSSMIRKIIEKKMKK